MEVTSDMGMDGMGVEVTSDVGMEVMASLAVGMVGVLLERDGSEDGGSLSVRGLGHMERSHAHGHYAE
jgi:hypothetical protein